MDNSEKTLDQLVALCKGRGFVYPGSEIYGGLANTWDYGPLGVELKENIKKAWRKKFIQENPYNVGLDSAILMNPQTWVASGHLGGFSDPLMDCCECKTRHRADDLIESFDGTNVAGWSNEEMSNYIKEHNIPCPNCGAHNFTDIRQFNLMFKTFQGASRGPTLNGLIIGEGSAVTGFTPLTSARITSDFVTTTRRNFASILRLQLTLNTNSHSVGVNFGVWLTEQTTTLLSISTQAARTLNTLTKLPVKSMFLMLLNRHSVVSICS